MLLQVAINNQSNLIDVIDNKQVKVNDILHAYDMIEIQDGKYLHIMYRNHSYLFEIIQFNKEEKCFIIAFDGHQYQVNVKDKMDMLLHSMGLDKLNTHKVNDVKAPMPGMVLNIKVKVGDKLAKGDPILILEAMKMENIIKSPAEGIVNAILIDEKQAVDKGQVLVAFE